MRTRDNENTRTLRAGALFAALALCAILLLICPWALAESDGMIRVKLTRLGTPSSLEMSADCDYILSTEPRTRIPAGSVMTVEASDGALKLTSGGKTYDLGASARLARTVERLSS